MVKIKITHANGTTKQYASQPTTLGLQKALARYGRDAMAAAKGAQALSDEDIDLTIPENLEQYDAAMAALEQLTEAKAQIVLLAFGGQFGLDELDSTPVTEIDRAVAELQTEAYGIVRKNA